MKTYLDCWIQVASSLLTQAVAGAPALVEALPRPMQGAPVGFTARVKGDEVGEFSVLLDRGVLEVPLMGEGADQQEAWGELLREIAEAAAGELLAVTGKRCQIEGFEPCGEASPVTRAFTLKGEGREWILLVRDRVRVPAQQTPQNPSKDAPLIPDPERKSAGSSAAPGISQGMELLLDVELEASLRFGSRELPLGDILDLGPGDVVQLDRQIADPVDLIVADKIVARGEVVLVNGNFGLRVTEVAAPRKRLESIRCLF
jgi:flagellar motor switch protein FliN